MSRQLPREVDDPRPVRLVVGAALTDDLFMPRRLLAARRSSPPALAGMWEFPGGKAERGETPLGALARELREELGVEVDLGDEVAGPDRADADVYGTSVGRCWELNPVTADGERLVMKVYWAQLAEGQPEPSAMEDHSELRWLEPGGWYDVAWIPADNRIVAGVIDDAKERHRKAYC